MPNADRTAPANPPVDFAPLDIVQAALSRWWLVSIFIILGGLAGWLVLLFQMPVYEARASILVTIDFTDTGFLTQFEEDLMMDAVGSLLQSGDVIGRVITNAQQQGIELDHATFVESSMIERRLGTWELRIRHTSPQDAMTLVNIWAAEGHSALSEAYRNAVLAHTQQRYLAALESCLQGAVVSEIGASSCNGVGFQDIQLEMQQASAVLSAAQLQSRGILAGTLFGQPETAGLPNRPAFGDRASMILAGAVIGFLLGFVLVQFNLRLPRRG